MLVLDHGLKELPWIKLVLPEGVYSVCDRALGSINFASALHRDSRDKVSTTVFVSWIGI